MLNKESLPVLWFSLFLFKSHFSRGVLGTRIWVKRITTWPTLAVFIQRALAGDVFEARTETVSEHSHAKTVVFPRYSK